MNKFLTPSEIYQKGCLTPEKHRALVERFDTYALVSGLGGGNRRFIWEPLPEMTKLELDALKKARRLPEFGKYGVLYVGGNSSLVVNRLMSITGCFVRNFVDARYVTIETAMKMFKAEGSVSGEVVCIPNLYAKGSSLGWQKGMMYDFLLHQMAEGKLIFAYAQDLEGVAFEYGQPAANHLLERFIKIGELKC